MSIQNLKFEAFPIPEIIGVLKKLSSLDMPMFPFLPNFSWAFVWMDPVNVCQNCSLRIALPVPEIIAIAVLGWVANPNLGEGGRRRWGMVPFERALVSSYRPSIVTFHLSLCVSEILLLLCSSTPHFPTPPLVSQNFPMFLWD